MSSASTSTPSSPADSSAFACATDPYIIIFLQVILVAFVSYVVFRDLRARRDEANGGLNAEVERGEKSMNALYTAYGASIASILVLMDNATHIDGHKVGLIILDFSCVTYLFLSSWFRNSVFFPLMPKLKKD